MPYKRTQPAPSAASEPVPADGDARRAARSEYYVFSLKCRTSKNPRDYLRSRWETAPIGTPFPESLPTATIKAILGYAIEWAAYVEHSVAPPADVAEKYEAHIALARGDASKLRGRTAKMYEMELAQQAQANNQQTEVPVEKKKKMIRKAPPAVASSSVLETPSAPRELELAQDSTAEASNAARPKSKPAAKRKATTEGSVAEPRKRAAAFGSTAVGTARKNYCAELIVKVATSSRKLTDEQIAAEVEKRFKDRKFPIRRVSVVRNEINNGKRAASGFPKPNKPYVAHVKGERAS